jgi:hypothetical protein
MLLSPSPTRPLLRSMTLDKGWKKGWSQLCCPAPLMPSPHPQGPHLSSSRDSAGQWGRRASPSSHLEMTKQEEKQWQDVMVQAMTWPGTGNQTKARENTFLDEVGECALGRGGALGHRWYNFWMIVAYAGAEGREFLFPRLMVHLTVRVAGLLFHACDFCSSVKSSRVIVCSTVPNTLGYYQLTKH